MGKTNQKNLKVFFCICFVHLLQGVTDGDDDGGGGDDDDDDFTVCALIKTQCV